MATLSGLGIRLDSRALAPLLLTLLLGACDDTIFGVPRDGTVLPDDTGGDHSGFCAVGDVFVDRCTGCHSAGSPSAGLDLVTDPHAALVGVASSQYDGAVLVVAGDAEGSLLYRKASSTQTADEGGKMPPGTGLSATEAEVVRAWIADGATEACDEPVDTGHSGTWHPEGWVDPAVHGLAAKLQEQACVDCHGEDLMGGSTGVSCDACHDAGWLTDCTFCHGGTDNLTGAPPRDIDGEDTDLAFSPHTAHVQADLSVAWDCVQCHVKPTYVLSPGHVFLGDSTPGRAEVSMAAGLSDRSTWSGSSCGDSYCHGNGRGDNGTVSASAGPMACDSCHPDITSGRDAWRTMSGEHEDHLREGVRCQECHGPTTSDGAHIADASLHVNGSKDVTLPAGMSRSGSTCAGVCHGEDHEGEPW